MTSNEEKRESPLTSEITHFVHIIAIVASLVALIFFFVALFQNGTNPGERIGIAFSFAIGIAFSVLN